jgi:hypothetical protein
MWSGRCRGPSGGRGGGGGGPPARGGGGGGGGAGAPHAGGGAGPRGGRPPRRLPAGGGGARRPPPRPPPGGRPPPPDVLDHVALTAPFHPDGPVRALLSVASGIIQGMDPSAVSSPPAPLPARLDYERFTLAVLQELSGPGSELARLMARWRLSISDVARLFGVSRQAVQQWLDDGVPSARQPKLLQVLRIGDLLERNLQPSRIPAVVRSDAGAFGGRSMLALIADDRHDDLLESVERSFDWASTA